MQSGVDLQSQGMTARKISTNKTLAPGSEFNHLEVFIFTSRFGVTLYQLLYKTHKEETVVRRNFGNQASRVHSSELNKSIAIVFGLISVGLVLVVSLRDRETNGSDKVCESGVLLCSTKLFSLQCNATFRFLWIFSQFNSLRARVLLALGNIRRRALSTSACFRNPVMSRASGPRVFKDKTADWICWRTVTVNFLHS